MAAMSQMAQAIQVGSLEELPSLQVVQLFNYGTRMMNQSTHPSDEHYYQRMRALALGQLEERQDAVAQEWRGRFGGGSK